MKLYKGGVKLDMFDKITENLDAALESMVESNSELLISLDWKCSNWIQIVVTRLEEGCWGFRLTQEYVVNYGCAFDDYAPK